MLAERSYIEVNVQLLSKMSPMARSGARREARLPRFDELEPARFEDSLECIHRHMQRLREKANDYILNRGEVLIARHMREMNRAVAEMEDMLEKHKSIASQIERASSELQRRIDGCNVCTSELDRQIAKIGRAGLYALLYLYRNLVSPTEVGDLKPM